MPGTITSSAEVTNISPRGFWLVIDGREHFLAYTDFPWFSDASSEEIRQVERPQPHRLRWPELDVDLTIASIEHPESYPLIAGSG